MDYKISEKNWSFIFINDINEEEIEENLNLQFLELPKNLARSTGGNKRKIDYVPNFDSFTDKNKNNTVLEKDDKKKIEGNVKIENKQINDKKIEKEDNKNIEETKQIEETKEIKKFNIFEGKGRTLN
jgi:hypothetical protein